MAEAFVAEVVNGQLTVKDRSVVIARTGALNTSIMFSKKGQPTFGA
jgi:uncharacterized beta-barrel protein YwiB (DUF1934 family)